jgi:release factor glutamine methyltransferase
MTARDAYELLSTKLATIYDEREAKTIARYLVEDMFKCTFWSENPITDGQLNQLNDAIVRLLRHEPWQYVGGIADFYGYKFFVDSSVLIPRPETEELVYLAIDFIKKRNLSSVLDIGTGSGIIPITISLKTDIAELYGIDLSEEALSIAIQNGARHQSNVAFSQNNILQQTDWANLPKVDLVISNPPYITEAEKQDMDPHVLQYEPHIALFVQQDPMKFYRAISAFVIEHQVSGCILLVEINEKFGGEVCDVFAKAGLANIALIKDMQEKDRIVIAERP